MTTPRVTENPLELTPVERDPFADGPAGRSRQRAPVTLERQVELVRDLMRTRAAVAGPRGRSSGVGLA